MEFIYLLSIKIYGTGIFLTSFFNPKAKLWISGRKNQFQKIASQVEGKRERKIWFHCSSYGEFEQGKPIIEAVKKEYSDYKIVLTFFSPSGYEAAKNDPAADYVFYLPLDGPLNARKFISLVRPSMSFFVKYDLWHYYIKELKARKIPLYILSTRFRPSQIYFQPYGKFFDKMLRRITHLFVQDQKSLELLYRHSLPHVTVSGDTRFDRVYQNYENAKIFPEIEKFCSGKRIFIAGSTWPDDEKLICQYINQAADDFKFIIAPHEINQDQINGFIKQLSKKCIRYSELKEGNVDAEVLIIDNIGMLSSLYRYGDVAYVGGAFGRGLHNILEAVVVGLPVFFGPHYHKFPEAVELIKNKTAFSISSVEKLKIKINEVFSLPATLENIKQANKSYITKNKGATDIVMNFLKINFN